MVSLSFTRSGPAYLGLLTPDRTISASTYGKEAGLPIVGWVGPDPKGYRLSRVQAKTSAGQVVADLTFFK